MAVRLDPPGERRGAQGDASPARRPATRLARQLDPGPHPAGGRRGDGRHAPPEWPADRSLSPDGHGWARSLHVAINGLVLLLFGWQAFTGIAIVRTLLSTGAVVSLMACLRLDPGRLPPAPDAGSAESAFLATSRVQGSRRRVAFLGRFSFPCRRLSRRRRPLPTITTSPLRCRELIASRDFRLTFRP